MTQAFVAAAADVTLPRGLLFEHTDAQMEHARELANQFEADFEAGNYDSVVNVTHDITNCDQICSNWCWATSATMTASAFGGGSDCAGNEAKAAGHTFGTTCDS